MKPWMFALLAQSRELVEMTFTSNATWTAPATTNALLSLIGKGASGTPSSTNTRQASAQVDSVQGFSGRSALGYFPLIYEHLLNSNRSIVERWSKDDRSSLALSTVKVRLKYG